MNLHPSFKTFRSLKTQAMLLMIITSVFLLNACTRHIVVNVNAITDMSAQPSGQRYVMTNADSSSATSDLYFQEFRTYFDHLLSKNGYIKVNERKDADIEIRFHYGVSDGKTAIQHYSWPIYETFGGERVTITERITDSGGNVQTINRTVYIPPVVRQVGSAHEAQSYTYFNRYINLAAFSAASADNDKNTRNPLWNVNVYSVGESDDLRAIMPFLAAASYPYLGKNSGQQQSVTLGNENPLVVELRNLVIQ